MDRYIFLGAGLLLIALANTAFAETSSDSKTITVRVVVPEKKEVTINPMPVLEENLSSYSVCVGSRGAGRYKIHIPENTSSARVSVSHQKNGRHQPLHSGEYSSASQSTTSLGGECSPDHMTYVNIEETEDQKASGVVRLIVTGE